MRMFSGMLLGAALTVGVAYYHDFIAASPTGTGTNLRGTQAMVNWDVVGANWNGVKARAREEWNKLAVHINRD